MITSSRDPRTDWQWSKGQYYQGDDTEYDEALQKGYKWYGGKWVTDTSNPIWSSPAGQQAKATGQPAPMGTNSGGKVKWAGGKAGQTDSLGRQYGSAWTEGGQTATGSMGYPTGGGAGGGSSTSSGSSWMSGGGDPGFSAQAAAWRSDMGRQRKEVNMRREEDVAMRGIKNGGTGAYLAGLDRDKMDIEEARGLERLQSDYWGQKTAFDLERQRAASSQGFSAGRGAGETFGNANQNAEALEYGQQQWGDGYSSKKKPAGGGASTGGYPTGVAGGVTGGGKSPAQVAQGRRDASSAFYKKYGHWPSPGELNDYMSGNMAQAPSYVGYS